MYNLFRFASVGNKEIKESRNSCPASSHMRISEISVGADKAMLLNKKNTKKIENQHSKWNNLLVHETFFFEKKRCEEPTKNKQSKNLLRSKKNTARLLYTIERKIMKHSC